MTISTTTGGATLRYTTDGSLPTETAGTLYSGPVMLSTNTLLHTIAYETGYLDSPVTAGFYALPQCAAPTFNPVPGAYSGAQTVTISTTTAGATMRYTTDGSVPSETHGTLYSAPVALSTVANLQAIVYKSGDADSTVTAGVYTLPLPVTNGLVLHLTAESLANLVMNGAMVSSWPDSSGNGFTVTAPLGVSGVTYVATGMNNSPTVCFNNNNPTFYEYLVTPNLSGDFVAASGGTICFVYNNPGSGALYTHSGDSRGPYLEPFWCSGRGDTYSAIPGGAAYLGWFLSNRLEGPYIWPSTGMQRLACTCTTTSGAGSYNVYLNGGNGATQGTPLWSGDYASWNSNVWQAPGVGRIGANGLGSYYGCGGLGGYLSEILIYNRVLTGTELASVDSYLQQKWGSASCVAPTFNPAPGSYSGAQTVTIGTTTPGAAIRYTTDGSTPSETNGTLYSGPVALSSVANLQAIAYVSGYADSSITVGVYTLSFPVTNGLVLQLTAESLANLANGATVSSWPDSSGNGFTATTPDGVTGVTYAASGLNSRPAVCINNTSDNFNQYLVTPNISDTFSGASGGTVCFVYDNPGSGVVYTTGDWVGPYLEPFWCSGRGDTYTGFSSGAGYPGWFLSNRIEGTYLWPSTGVQRLACTCTTMPGAGSYNVYLNGGNGTTQGTPLWSGNYADYNSNVWQTPCDCRIGANGDSQGGLGGYISEILMYNRVLTATELANVDSYLQNKWGPVSCAAPTYNLQPGTYSSGQTVLIYTNTNGATIRYSTDGSTPSETHGTLYSSPVTINSSCTLQAIAYETGLSDSCVTSGVYTLQCAAPSFTPAAGTYNNATAVTISTTSTGASIRYTTNGTTPSSTVGTVYSSPVSITATGTTLKAIAYETGYNNSSVTSGTYILQCATPSFTPAAGTYNNATAVTISTTSTGATIRYTTNGTTPSSTVGTVYSTPVSITAISTLKALAYETGYNNSGVTSGTYTIQCAAPSFTPAAGTYNNATSVTISTTTTGATIRYTTNGTTPSSTVGTVYSTPVSITATSTLKALAYETGYSNSGVTSGTYTIQCAAPSFTPAAGSYTSATVTITTTTSGASLRYTTNGTTPSSTVGTVYSTPVVLSQTGTLQAIAYKTGLANSSVTSGVYTMYLGTTTVGGSNTAITANEMHGTRFQAGSAITLNHIMLDIGTSATGNINCALYSDNTGVPGALLKGCTQLSNAGTGWQTFTLLAHLGAHQRLLLLVDVLVVGELLGAKHHRQRFLLV